MIIDWILDLPVEPSVRNLLQCAADQCLVAEEINCPCSVSVTLCDDSRIRDVNQQFRDIDRSTDVLSFPSIRYPEGKTAGECIDLLRQEYDDDLNSCFLGDIVISVPHIVSQAREYGHSFEREAAYLLVHGICHLMGYDHMTDQDKIKMRKKEEMILAEISIPVLIENLSDDDRELIRYAVQAMENSYSPYSHFPVGAAIRAKNGKIFTGCNIENVSFGLTNCAERTAVFKAVSEGVREFDTIAIAGNQIPWPCGACRQVLSEFAPSIRILLYADHAVTETNLNVLLPHSISLTTEGNEK